MGRDNIRWRPYAEVVEEQRAEERMVKKAIWNWSPADEEDEDEQEVPDVPTEPSQDLKIS